MVLRIIRADILLIVRIFPCPTGDRKSTTQLAKYPRVLYVKPSNKIYVFPHQIIMQPSHSAKDSIWPYGPISLLFNTSYPHPLDHRGLADENYNF